LTEVLSGKVLNDRLREIGSVKRPGAAGPDVPLDPGLLRRINLTRGLNGANIGLLKKRGPLAWPPALHGPTFEADRNRIDGLLAPAAKQAKAGQVEPTLIRDFTQSLDGLGRELAAQVADVSPLRYIEAKRYLNAMHDTLTALRDPDVAAYFTAAEALPARCESVAGLITYMNANGWRFAPAVAGDEAAYRALDLALTAFAERGRHPRGQK
jgi:hypothetical protein